MHCQCDKKFVRNSLVFETPVYTREKAVLQDWITFSFLSMIPTVIFGNALMVPRVTSLEYTPFVCCFVIPGALTAPVVCTIAFLKLVRYCMQGTTSLIRFSKKNTPEQMVEE